MRSSCNCCLPPTTDLPRSSTASVGSVELARGRALRENHTNNRKAPRTIARLLTMVTTAPLVVLFDGWFATDFFWRWGSCSFSEKRFEFGLEFACVATGRGCDTSAFRAMRIFGFDGGCLLGTERLWLSSRKLGGSATDLAARRTHTSATSGAMAARTNELVVAFERFVVIDGAVPHGRWTDRRRKWVTKLCRLRLTRRLGHKSFRSRRGLHRGRSVDH